MKIRATSAHQQLLRLTPLSCPHPHRHENNTRQDLDQLKNRLHGADNMSETCPRTPFYSIQSLGVNPQLPHLNLGHCQLSINPLPTLERILHQHQVSQATAHQSHPSTRSQKLNLDQSCQVVSNSNPSLTSTSTHKSETHEHDRPGAEDQASTWECLKWDLTATRLAWQA